MNALPAGRHGERVTLIRSKNAAFAALHRAEVLCYQKGKRGPLPTGWLARLAELRSEYRAACLCYGRQAIAAMGEEVA